MKRDLRRRALLRTIPVALAPAARRLESALANPDEAQDRLRDALGRRLARTRYGQHVGVYSARDFHKAPLATYEDLQPWLDEQRRCENNAITTETVRFYERTSGSSGAAKYIPYTRSLRRAFSDMFAAWAFDVLTRGPRLRSGKLYMSVSPSIGQAEQTEQGRAVGLDNDADYLDGWLQKMLSPFLVQLPSTERFSSAIAFKDALALTLLKAPSLEVFSVWSPSFLDVIFDHIGQNRGHLAAQLPPERAKLIDSEVISWAALWPQLRLISCWDQGAAAPLADRLRGRFPGALVQGKGLLATEAPVTVPWTPAGGCVPLVAHTLIELIDHSGDIRPLTAAKRGETYELALSTLGGLCRYRIGDQVTVTHHYGPTPCLRFVGRTGGVSDLVGEKLSESLVSAVLRRHLPNPDGMITLVPLAGPPAGYVLLSDGPLPGGAVKRIEADLAEAYHYGLARGLGQLAPLRAAVDAAAGQWIAEREMRRGMKWGDIKPRTVQPRAADTTLKQLLLSAITG